MKQTKILLAVFIIAIAGFTINPAKAQQRQQQMAEMVKNSTPEQRANMQTTMMTTKLGLDSATKMKVYDANLKAAKNMDPIIKGEGRRMSKMREMKSIEEQKDKDLKSALTPEQYKQYETMKEEMKEKMKEKMAERKETKN
jgi:hypothetical protein